MERSKTPKLSRTVCERQGTADFVLEILTRPAEYMPKRNHADYLRAAEDQIDTAWKSLDIFQENRARALLSAVTVADDRFRFAAIRGLNPMVQFTSVVRYAQEALNYAIQWIYAVCPPSNSPGVELITDADYLRGMQLLDYAAAYDSAVLAFTNFHLGRFDAFVAKKAPRITFRFVSTEADEDETAKRAYELAEQRAIPADLITDDSLAPLVRLSTIIASKARRQ